MTIGTLENGMSVKTWSEIRARKHSPEELLQIDREVEAELLEMDLGSLREAVGLPQEELADSAAHPGE